MSSSRDGKAPSLPHLPLGCGAHGPRCHASVLRRRNQESGLLAQLPVTVADQVVHVVHEQPDGFAAGLLALDPGDLIASDVLGRVALLADQLPVRELARVVQGAHLVADLLAGLLAQEVVHHADAVLVHAGHDVLQRQLQCRHRLRLPVGPQAAVAQPLARRVTRRVQVRLLLVQRRAGQQLLLRGLRLSGRRYPTLNAGGRAGRGRGRRGVGRGLGLRLRLGRVSGGPRARGLDGSVPARRRLPGLPDSGGPGRRRAARLLRLARAGGRNVLADLAHELVLLPVLPLVLLAAVEGAAAAATAQQVLHLPAQLAVLPVSLARARPAGPAAVIGHGGGGGGGGRAGGVAAGRPSLGPGSGRSGRGRHCAMRPPPLASGDRRPAPSARPRPRPSVAPRSAGRRLSASSPPRAEGARARRARPAALAAAASAFRAAGPGPRSSAGRAGATRSARSARTPRPRGDPGGRRARRGAGQAEGRAEGAAAARSRLGRGGAGAASALPHSASRASEPAPAPPAPADPAPSGPGTQRGRPASRGRVGAAPPQRDPRPARCLHLLGRARPPSRRGAGRP
ncbi:transcription initiation factor TFIID subunit 4-like [Cervus canadensis]|uniref:transcription initiation factor TFIID subunit 4-like n=1 Tax=Cervus canadensis TaxID=1574408 RepID=UPI001C9E394A|nr:transcription initiation factor TFIID subunit 4-like [Cervus canadensis]